MSETENVICSFCGKNKQDTNILIAGNSAWYQHRKEIFPDKTFDAVIVSVPYPNATPEEVISGVVIPVEEAIAEVEGIKQVTSNAVRNLGTLTIEVETSYNTRDVMASILLLRKQSRPGLRNWSQIGKFLVLRSPLIRMKAVFVIMLKEFGMVC